MPKFRIQVADKDTGDEHVFDRYARSEDEARQKAAEAGWLVMSCNPLPADEIRKSNKSHVGLWTPSDPAERAVVRGVVKAYVIITLINLALAGIGFVIYAIATEA